MNHEDNAEGAAWWAGLSEAERNIWLARARGAGTDAWQLKKASIFDRGVTFDQLLREIAANGEAAPDPNRVEQSPPTA